MFKKNLTMVDEFIRRSMRPKPIIAALPEGTHDCSQDEEQTVQKVSHLGHTARVTGDISLEENLCIEGAIEGTIKIRGKRLTVSKKSMVKGEIHARTVEVRGTVKGDIHGEDVVHLHGSASVIGNVHCKRVLIDDGAQFDGTLKTLRETVKPVDIKKTTKPSELKDASKTDDGKPKLRSVSG